MKKALIFAVISLPMLPTWAVNKCVGQDGKIAYQETACAAANSSVVLDRSASPATTRNVVSPAEAAGALDAQIKGNVLDQMDRNAQERNRLLSGAKPVAISATSTAKIHVGMRRDQVLKAWGNPSKINHHVAGHGTSEQWVYPRGAAAVQYVHLTDGVVTSVSTYE